MAPGWRQGGVRVASNNRTSSRVQQFVPPGRGWVRPLAISSKGGVMQFVLLSFFRVCDLRRRDLVAPTCCLVISGTAQWWRQAALSVPLGGRRGPGAGAATSMDTRVGWGKAGKAGKAVTRRVAVAPGPRGRGRGRREQSQAPCRLKWRPSASPHPGSHGGCDVGAESRPSHTCSTH